MIYDRKKYISQFNVVNKNVQQSKKESLNNFLSDLFSISNNSSDTNGMIRIVADNEEFFQKHYNLDKMYPIKESTPTIVDNIINMSTNIYVDVMEQGYNNKIGKYYDKGLYSISLDLDDILPSNDLSDEEMCIELYTQYPIFTKIKPSYIIFSGDKGIHIYYIFNENIINKKMIIEQIYELFKNFVYGIDYTKCCLKKALRIPYTINSKTQKEARIIKKTDKYNFNSFVNICNEFLEEYVYIESDDRYMINLQEYLNTYGGIDEIPEDDKIIKLTEEFMKIQEGKKTFRVIKSKKKHSKKVKNTRCYNNLVFYYQNILKLCINNIIYRYGNITGYRNNHMYLMCVAMHNLQYSKNHALNELKKWNEELCDSLQESSLKSIVKCVYKHKYRIASETILGYINPCECALAKCCINFSKKEKEDAKKRRNKLTATQQKKDRGFEKKQRILIKAITRYLQNTNLSYREIATELCISKSTIAYYVKKFNISRIKVFKKCKTLKKVAAFVKIKKIISVNIINYIDGYKRRVIVT